MVITPLTQRVLEPAKLSCHGAGISGPCSSPTSAFACVSLEVGGTLEYELTSLVNPEHVSDHEWQQSCEQLQPFSADVTVTVYVGVVGKETRTDG